MDDPPVFRRCGHWSRIDTAKQALNEFNMLRWNANPAAWRRKEASWRRMEVTRPPIRTLRIEDVLYSGIGVDRIRRGQYMFPLNTTLRMGELYDCIEKRALHYQEDSGNNLADT